MLSFLSQKITIPGAGGKPVQLEGVKGFAFTDLGSVLSKSVQFVFAFAGIGLLLMLLSAGFTFLTSGGEPKKMEMAKGKLTSALLGFVIIFAAYWGVQAAAIIFGVPELKQIFK